MNFQEEKRICQNCKKDFVIESDDFNFYEKIKVPPPTFCPECRFQRRMVWRNERTLFKRKCDLCQKNIIAMYRESVPFPVYCRECWYGDGWDATSFGREYDFNKTFFEQYKELMDLVPRFAIWHRDAINCPYSNLVRESKNVYLSASILGSENVFYSKTIDNSFNVFDSYNLKNSHECYENIDSDRNYNSQYLFLSRNCVDCCYLIDCTNCSNCFMSSNLRNKQFYVRNKRYTKEGYLKEIEKLNLGSKIIRSNLIDEFQTLRANTIYRYADITQSNNSTGNELTNTKNCKKCFSVYDAENLKYCHRFLKAKDCFDSDHGGINTELLYECNTGARNDYNVKFSYSPIDQVRDVDYTDSCMSSKNLFGCVGMKNQENVILNKVYSKEEFEILREQIIKQMDDAPFIDKAGRVYRYGEFFPIELSPWAYNETLSQEFFPLSKEEVEKNGYSWCVPEVKNFEITIQAENIKDNIDEVDEGILKEVLGCAHKGKCDHQCSVAFRITETEFKFYKKHNIPIPDKCANCRYGERFMQVPLPRLYKRQCMKKGCSNEFETPYASDRPEIIYCERCYQQEIY